MDTIMALLQNLMSDSVGSAAVDAGTVLSINQFVNWIKEHLAVWPTVDARFNRYYSFLPFLCAFVMFLCMDNFNVGHAIKDGFQYGLAAMGAWHLHQNVVKGA